jgi:hypothetical protein
MIGRQIDFPRDQPHRFQCKVQPLLASDHLFRKALAVEARLREFGLLMLAIEAGLKCVHEP